MIVTSYTRKMIMFSEIIVRFILFSVYAVTKIVLWVSSPPRRVCIARSRRDLCSKRLGTKQSTSKTVASQARGKAIAGWL